MALIKCLDCGTDVSDAAPACPKCGRPIAAVPVRGPYRQPPPPKSSNISGVVVLIVFICLGLWIYGQVKDSDSAANPQTSGASQTSSDDTTQRAEATASPTPKADVIAITPEELYQKYDANEVATDDALAGKIVQITAPVKSIDKDFTDSAVLEFSSGQQFNDVGVSLDDSEKAKAARLSRGQIITVQCKTMHRIVDSPRGEHCVLIDTPVVAPSNVSSPVQSAEQTQDVAAQPIAETAATDPTAAQVDGAAGSSHLEPVASTTSTSPAASPATPDAQAALQKVIDNPSGPSFDCSTVTNITARAICGNANLSKLDRQMAILYYTRTNYGTDPAARDQQRAWIHSRNNSCVADVVCLTDQFNQRIQELRSSQTGASVIDTTTDQTR